MIQSRLENYAAKSVQEAEHALKEITQEIVLSALAQSGFFKKAAFQGGTCLRIVHGLNRFSEDLDFCLFSPDPRFALKTFMDMLKLYLQAYGYDFDIQDKSKTDSAIQKLFMKENAIGLLLQFHHGKLATPQRPIRIKIEIDTNPPFGSGYSTEFIDFPSPFAVVCQDKPSLFASKSHALLCRPYTKGRDWYDFLWYIGQKIVPNYVLLTHALMQTKHLPSDTDTIGASWYINALKEKIKETDWAAARNDVARFIKPQEQHSLDLWHQDYFLAYLDRFERFV